MKAQPSNDPGAWTCGACGFRGFWSGGPHECEPVQQPTGWKCTGYMHGCFCPTCSQRDIARAEVTKRRAASTMLLTGKAVRHG